MFIYPDEVLCGGKPCNVKQDVTFGAVLEPVYVLEGRRRRRQRKKRGREFGQCGLEEPQRRRVVSASRVRSGWTRTAPRASEAPAAEAAAGDSATSREVTSLTRARTAVSSPAPWLPVSRRLAQTETNSLTLSDSNA